MIEQLVALSLSKFDAQPRPRIFGVALPPFQIDDCWDGKYATNHLPFVTNKELELDELVLKSFKQDLAKKSPELVEFMDDPNLRLRNLLSSFPFIPLKGNDRASRKEMMEEVKHRLLKLRQEKNNQKKTLPTTKTNRTCEAARLATS